jgi:hypothetical protein
VTDFLVRDEGSILLLEPVVPAVEEWFDEHLAGDVTLWGRAVVVEHRYIEDIVNALEAEGLVGAAT